MQYDQATGASEISVLYSSEIKMLRAGWDGQPQMNITFYVSPKRVWVILLWLLFAVLLPKGKSAGMA